MDIKTISTLYQEALVHLKGYLFTDESYDKLCEILVVIEKDYPLDDIDTYVRLARGLKKSGFHFDPIVPLLAEAILEGVMKNSSGKNYFATMLLCLAERYDDADARELAIHRMDFLYHFNEISETNDAILKREKAKRDQQR